MLRPATYLDVADNVVLDRGEGDGAQRICSATWQCQQEDKGVNGIPSSRCGGAWAQEGGGEAGQTEDGSQRLGGIEELGGGDGILVVGIDGHVSEGLLEGVQQGAAGWERRGRHDGRCIVVSGEEGREKKYNEA